MNSIKPSQAIFFDVGETLIRPRRPYGELLRQIAHEHGVDLPEEAFAGLAARIDGRVTERTRRRLPFTFPAEESQRFWFETYQGFFVDFVSPNDADQLAQAYLDLLSSPDGYELFEDTIETLMRLRERGYRLGIISNWESWLPSLLEAVGIAALFDYVVISGKCGFEKPDSRIFALALTETGYHPDEVVYIGDRPDHDVEPALKMRIKPILLDRSARYRQDHRHQTISALSDLMLALDHSQGTTAPSSGLPTGKR